MDVFQCPKFKQLDFFNAHPIQPFEMMDLPSNGKSAFHCKDGTQCPWHVFHRSRLSFILHSLAYSEDQTPASLRQILNNGEKHTCADREI